MDAVETKWIEMEAADVDQEGWLLVPTMSNPVQYAAKGAAQLFETREEAMDTLTQLISRGVVGLGTTRVAKAKLSHHRKVWMDEADLTYEPDQTGLIITG